MAIAITGGGSGDADAVAADLATHEADTAVHSSGRAKAVALLTASVTGITSTSYTDLGLTLPQFTIDSGGRPVLVELMIPKATNTNAAGITYAAITTSANTILNEGYLYTGVAFGTGQLFVPHYITAAGTYDLKVRTKVSAGTGEIGVNTSGQQVVLIARDT